jgi:hypothetical protein
VPKGEILNLPLRKSNLNWENIPLKRGRRRVKLGRERGKGV